MHKQTTFSLLSGKSRIMDEFIESQCNREAYSKILSWPNNWGVKPYELALILKGPKSSGKSMISHIWADKSRSLFIARDTILSANDIANCAGFVIDGFDSSWNEEAALHHFNILHEKRKFLLITTEDFSFVKLPDLSSRLKSCDVVSIGMPDDELLKVFIFKLFSENSILVENNVVEYLMKLLPRDFISISQYINELNSKALIEQKKITIPFVKLVLRGFLDSSASALE